ncbi:MAG: hypothetical protein ABL879_17585, partial [Devosia sp.]
MSQQYYSHRLNRVLEVPDNFTDEQVAAWENELAPSVIGTAARQLRQGFKEGIALIPEAIGGLTGTEAPKGLASLIRDNPVDRALWGTALGDGSMDDANPKTKMVAGLAGNIASMMLPGSAARIAGFAPRAVKAATVAGSMLSSAGEATREVDRNRAEGMDVTPEQGIAAAWQGLGPGVLDSIVPTRLLGRVDDFGGRKLAETGLARLGLRALGTGGIEAGTEGLQQVGLNAVERGYNPEQALNEGVLESLQAGGGAGFAIDMGLSLLGKRVARNGWNNIKREMGAPPKIPDDGIAGIGIRRGENGEADISAIRARAEAPPVVEKVPHWSEDKTPFLDAASKAIFDKPLAELDALTAINLDRNIETFRNQNQVNDAELLDVLQNMAPVGPKPDPRRSWDPGIEGMIARSMGVDPTGMGPAGLPPAPPLDAYGNASPPPLDLGSLPVQRSEERPRPIETEGITPGVQMPKRPSQLRMTDEGTFEEPSRAREPGPGAYRQDIDDMRRRDEAASLAGYTEQQHQQAEAAKRRPQDELNRMRKRAAGVTVPETGAPDERTTDANQRISRQLFRRDFDQLTPDQRAEVDQYRSEGLGYATNPQELAEVAEFGDLPFSRDQYRQAVAIGRDAYAKRLPLSRTAVQGGLKTTPDIASQIMAHIEKRGEGIVENGKLYVDPTAEGPMYSLATEQQAPQAYTVEGLTEEVDAKKQPQIALDLLAELKSKNIDDVFSTKLTNQVFGPDGGKAHGKYKDRVITLSLEAADKKKLIETLNHE